MPNGMKIWPDHLSVDMQKGLISEVRAQVRESPLFQPVMPGTGKPFSVRMTNLGSLGWVSDQKGYRYQDIHPVTGEAWPDIPQVLLDLWAQLTAYPDPPECCLVNFYKPPNAKMGLHRDMDEEDMAAPVLSVSLGDSCTFRIGGQTRKGPTESLRLNSGTIIMLGGEARTCFHGVDKVHFGSSQLLNGGGRLNLTLRRVKKT